MADLGSLETKAGAGEFAGLVLRIEGEEISVWKRYSYNSHYLTPSDSWSFEVGDEVLNPALRKLLVPGNRVEFLIDGVLQAAGYIDVVDSTGDRSSGMTLHIEGRDTLSPMIDSQIDPAKKFPEKTTLEKLIAEVALDFGFEEFETESDVAIRLGKKIPPKRHKKKKNRFLSDFPLPKKKPQHNDTYFGFLSRITQRYGLWVMTSANGKKLIIAKPDYDQDPQYQARWRFKGADNNIQSGGIRRDATEQPTFISVRGDMPGRSVEHQQTRVVIDNPYVAGLEFGLSFQEQSAAFDEASKVGKGKTDPATGAWMPGDPIEDKLVRGDIDNPSAAAFISKVKSGGDTGIRARQDDLLGQSMVGVNPEQRTFIESMKRFHTEVIKKWTTLIPVIPIKIINAFATKVSRPRFLKDSDSHTREELEHFARRQMSLCTRKAFVAHYEFMGHKIDGNIVQPDTIIDVDDEAADFKGPLWILSRTFLCNRSGGLTVSIEALPLQSIQF